MARTGNNSRVPVIGQYPQTSGATFGTDLTELANDVASLIGEAEPTFGDLPASGNWPGRTIYVIGEGATYVWTGSAWAYQSGGTKALSTSAVVTLGAGMTLIAAESNFRINDKMISGVLAVSRNTGTFLHADVVATVAAAFRPVVPTPLPSVLSGASPANVGITTLDITDSGKIKVLSPSAAQPKISIACNWMIS